MPKTSSAQQKELSELVEVLWAQYSDEAIFFGSRKEFAATLTKAGLKLARK